MVFCSRCNRHFPKRSALEQHKRDSPKHFVCEEGCDDDFSSYVDLKLHYACEHHYCSSCEELFDDEEDLEDHNAEVHDDVYCSSCQRMFVDEQALEQHYTYSSSHFYCAPCKRHFKSEKSLRYHMNSKKHQPRDFLCPLRGCNCAFISQSALVHHFESGGCGSRGVDRKFVNAMVQKYDTKHVITDPTRLIASSGSTTYFATSAAWNGAAYECYLCHRTYRTLESLNQHLSSPAHEADVYICPLSSCKTRFNTLSGLCQHIESERCGVLKFKGVKDALDGIMMGMKKMKL